MPDLVCCLTNSYGRFGARAAIENVRSAGLEHVELPIRTAGVPSPFQDDPLVTNGSSLEDLKRVDRLLERHGVRVASCGVMPGDPLDPEGLKLIQRKLDLASHFGVEVVVGNAGEAETREELRSLHAHLADIGDYAARLGITYCFETHPGICRNHYRMLETMEALQHPHLKLNFDTANILYYNENVVGEVALAKVCHHVRHVHLKDSMGEYGRWYFPALGSGGGVDFFRVRELLSVCGFHGPYSIEIEGIAGEPEPSLQECHRRVRDSVDYLRTCGYFD